MKRKTLIIFLAFAAVLSAQTGTVTVPKLVIWTGSGVIFAPLPSGWTLQMDPATGAATLTQPTFQPPIDDWQQLSASQPTFQLKCPAPSNLRAYRNGLRVHLGFDFDANGATVTFRAAATPQAADTVEFEYSCQNPANTGSQKAN